MDAQHWGVPQRRKRIALVLDLTGECAGEVLFEPESLRGHFAPCIAARQAATGNAETGTAGTNQSPPLSYTLKIRSGCEGGGKGALVQTEKSATLSTLQDQTLFVADALPFDTTQLTSPQNGSNPQWGNPCHPLAASAHTPTVVTELSRKVFCIAGNVIDRSDTAGANGTGVKEDVSYTLNTVDRPAVVYDARGNDDGKVVPTMTGDHNGHISDYSTVVVEKVVKWIVRRLTPTECERLQGYPDDWTALGEWADSKGKLHKDADSPRYKALGNSIALPQWYYVLGGISDRLTENATLGSLFDGIGGFPKVWADLHNGNKKLCVWASEIEEFPIAVTRKHFPEE
jgi:DNA (cytosine-5)-methyltransferase 1